MSVTSRILSIDGNRDAEVSTGNALEVMLSDSTGEGLSFIDGEPLDPTRARGFMIVGRDYKIARMQRSSPDGTLRIGPEMCIFYDSIEGTTVDLNKWIATSATMTQSQTTGSGTLYNAASPPSTTSGQATMNLTSRFFPFIGRGSIIFRTRVRHTSHYNNNLIESGFGSPTSSTAASIVNGAIWRKRDSDGAYLPVISINGSEITGAAITQATFLSFVASSDYFYQEIFLEESRATFKMTTQSGTIISEQFVNFGTTIGTFTVTHLQIMHRINNTGTVSDAVLYYVAQTSVWLADAAGPDYATAQTQMNYGSLTSPTAYTQVANYTNNAAATTLTTGSTLTNTTAGYANLGGQYQFFLPSSSAETDYALFGYQVPVPYSFVCTGVSISAVNDGYVNSGTTDTIIQWGLGFNSSAVSLATSDSVGNSYAPRRKRIGMHYLPINAAIGQSCGPDTKWTGKEVVLPGRFLVIICKMPQAVSINGTQIIRGTVDVNGYFE